MGDGGVFCVASLCSRHEVPKYHQFFSLCILFSLTLAFFSLGVSRPYRLFFDDLSS